MYFTTYLLLPLEQSGQSKIAATNGGTRSMEMRTFIPRSYDGIRQISDVHSYAVYNFIGNCMTNVTCVGAWFHLLLSRYFTWSFPLYSIYSFVRLILFLNLSPYCYLGTLIRNLYVYIYIRFLL